MQFIHLETNNTTLITTGCDHVTTKEQTYTQVYFHIYCYHQVTLPGDSRTNKEYLKTQKILWGH